MNLREDEHSVDFDFERAVPGKVNEFLLPLIVVSLHLCAVSCTPAPMLGVMLWGFILRDSYIFDDGLGFFNDAVEENLVLLLIVP